MFCVYIDWKCTYMGALLFEKMVVHKMRVSYSASHDN